MFDSRNHAGLFVAFERLVRIDVCGNEVEVPEHNNLLRCFQFVEMDRVSTGNYCWNGDCSNCRIWFKPKFGGIKSALACRTVVRPGLVITGLSQELETALGLPERRKT